MTTLYQVLQREIKCLTRGSGPHFLRVSAGEIVDGGPRGLGELSHNLMLQRRAVLLVYQDLQHLIGANTFQCCQLAKFTILGDTSGCSLGLVDKSKQKLSHSIYSSTWIVRTSRFQGHKTY